MKNIVLTLIKPVAFFIGYGMKLFKIKSYINGFKIRFPDEMTAWERGSIWGNYEGHERKLVKKYITSQDAVLELGACLGVVSLTINEIIQNPEKQVSVEPNPDMLKYLEENRNNNKGRFIIENRIVSKESEVFFAKGGEAFLSSSVVKNVGENICRVEGITFWQLEEKYFPFSALVMDIEGAELEFFRSFDLSKSAIKSIIIEFHPHLMSEAEVAECKDFLHEYGYKFQEKSADTEAWTKDKV